jgi:isopentenyl-diphosphate delta-isomerase
MLAKQYVVLCDQNGQAIGTKDKLQAHIDGDLHLAFSVQICRPAQDGRNGYEWLLQQRAIDKYHSGGLWANTCCSHPLLDETLSQACLRRVQEELNIVVAAPVQTLTHFIYQAALDNQLIEHEYDYILLVEQDVPIISPNSAEVMATQWYHSDDIQAWLDAKPEHFAVWFKQVFTHVKNHLNQS